MITPAQIPLTIRKNASFTPIFVWTETETGLPIDLTGCTAEMVIKESMHATRVKIRFSTENGLARIDVQSGTLLIECHPADLRKLNITEGVYDLRVVFPSGWSEVIAEGTVSVLTGVGA